MKQTKLIGLALLLASTLTGLGFSSYQALIPNGTTFACATCHIVVPPRLNPFGVDFSNRQHVWNAALAALDSDGDGFANGVELGDSDGNGVPTAGAVVSNPGDPTSRPPGTTAVTVVLTAPANNTRLASPASFVLTAQANPIASIVTLDFLQGSTVLTSVIIPAGSPNTISTPVANLGAGTYSFTARASIASGALTTSLPITVVVTNAVIVPPPPPGVDTVTVVATDAIAAEIGPDPGEFTITRTGPMTNAITVHYLLGGTAVNGSDYAAIPTSAVLPIGSATAVLAVLPVPDIDIPPEILDTVILTLSPDVSYAVGTPSVATVTITEPPIVSGTNVAPVVSIRSPRTGQSFRANRSITIRATASDADGRVVRVEIFSGTTSLGLAHRSEGGRWTLTWRNVPAGDYILVAAATDNSGTASFSAPVTIHVTARSGGGGGGEDEGESEGGG